MSASALCRLDGGGPDRFGESFKVGAPFCGIRADGFEDQAARAEIRLDLQCLFADFGGGSDQRIRDTRAVSNQGVHAGCMLAVVFLMRSMKGWRRTAASSTACARVGAR